jgi:transcriptional regulator with XRE-family HTH domain
MQVNPHALRVIRERSGLSVSELARAAGLSQPHLSNIEIGRRQASPSVIRALADALRVPLLSLITDPAGVVGNEDSIAEEDNGVASA